MLNNDIVPFVCEKGSVGACGDLAPMAQIALAFIGEGEVLYQGKRMSSNDAFSLANIPIPNLEERDGLALINGSNSELMAQEVFQRFRNDQNC